MDPQVTQDIGEVLNRVEDLRDHAKDRTILISGGAGFLGSWFSDILLGLGARVIAVDNLITGSKDNISHLSDDENFKFVDHDVSTFSTNEEIDYIIHMSAIASTPLYQKHPIATLDSNILGIKNMLLLARKKQVKRFLFTSTSEIYGSPPDDKIPTTEEYYGYVNSYGPRSMYDEAKRSAESYCYSYWKQFNLPIRVARIFNTYGPRLDVRETSHYGRALVKFIVRALEDQPIAAYGDGKQTRSFCYVTDQMVGLTRLLLTPQIDGEVVNIGNGQEVTILELIRRIIEKTSSRSKLDVNAKPDFDIRDDPRRRCPDISKAKKLFGYEPRVDLDEGLARTIRWFKTQKR